MIFIDTSFAIVIDDIASLVTLCEIDTCQLVPEPLMMTVPCATAPVASVSRFPIAIVPVTLLLVSVVPLIDPVNVAATADPTRIDTMFDDQPGVTENVGEVVNVALIAETGP